MSDRNTNLCIFTGNLGADPETRYLTNGTAVTNFSLACGWKTKTKNGTEWVKCVAWGKLAEICSEYLKKGKPVMVQGTMRTREYQKEGDSHKSYFTEIHIQEMEMLGSGGQDSGGGQQRPQQNQQQASPTQQDDMVEEFDSDIPF